MIAAVNSKQNRYDPLRYMMNGRGLKQQQRAASKGMTGDQILTRFKQLGVRVIDNRKRDGIV